MTKEIRLIQNKSENYFRVTINGMEAYSPFIYSDDFSKEDNEMNVRRTAKACAFDEICRALHNGNQITVSYDSF